MQIEFVSEEKPKGLLIEPVDVQESPGFFSMMGRGLTKGVLDIAQSTGTGLRWLGTRTGMESLQRAGETTEKYWEEAGKPFEAPPELRGAILENPALMKDPAWWAYNVANIVPSFAASMVPGIGAYKYINVAGKAVKFTPQVIEKLAKVGAAVTGGVSGGSLEGANTYQEIIKKGGSEQDAAKAGEIMTLASTGLNALSVGKALTPGALGRVKHVLTSAGVESITEYLEEPAEAGIKYGMGYATPEEVKRQLIEGANVIPPTFLTGGLGGAAGRAATTPAGQTEMTAAPVPPTEVQKVVQKYREKAAKREKPLKIEPVEEVKEEAAPAQELNIEPVSVKEGVTEKEIVPYTERTPEEKALINDYNKKMDSKEWVKAYENEIDRQHFTKDEGHSPLADELIRDLEKEGLKKGASVLEIGSGAGRDAVYLAEKGHSISGIDVSGKAVKIATERARGKDASFQVGDAENLYQFENNSKDAVYSVAALHGTPIKFTFQEIFRVLKPGGQAKLFLYTRTKTGGKWISYWTPGEIKQYAKEAGFSIEKFREGHNTEPIDIPGVSGKVEQETHLAVTTLRKPKRTEDITPASEAPVSAKIETPPEVKAEVGRSDLSNLYEELSSWIESNNLKEKIGIKGNIQDWIAEQTGRTKATWRKSGKNQVKEKDTSLVTLSLKGLFGNTENGEYLRNKLLEITRLRQGKGGKVIPSPPPPLSEAQKGLTYQELNRQVKEYKGTGGISSEGKMKPGFKDKETGEVYPSLDAEGNEASVHLLDGLPEGVVLRKNEHGEVTEVKGAIEPGFIKEGKFLTRDEAVAEARRAKFGAKEAPSPSLATSTPTQKLQSVVAVKNLKTGEVYTGSTHAQIVEEKGLNPAAGGEEWSAGYQVGGKFYKGEKEALAAMKGAEKAPEIPQVEGLKYNGIQKIPDMPDQYVFTDEKTGSTFYSKDLGPKALEAKRDEMRARFAAEAAKSTKPPAEPRQRIYHFTKKENIQKILDEGFNTKLPPVHGTGALQKRDKYTTENKTGTDVLYFTTDRDRWNKVDVYVGGGKGTKDYPFYDYEQQKWVAEKKAKATLDLSPIEAEVKANANILTIDSYKSYMEFQKKHLKEAFIRDRLRDVVNKTKELGYDILNLKHTGKGWEHPEGRLTGRGEKDWYQEATGGSGKNDFFILNRDAIDLVGPETKSKITEPAPEAKPGAPAKEAWKMTQAEWNSKTRFYRSGNTKNAQLPTGERVVLSLESTATNFLEKSKSFLDEMRKRVIQNALSEGKPVPPEVLKDYPEVKPGAPAKEPWEMTRGEFNSDAWYHGADEEAIRRLQGTMKGSSGWITLDSERAAQFPKSGKPGSIVVILGSHRPKTISELKGTTFETMPDLSSIRESAVTLPEKAHTLSQAKEAENTPIAAIIPREAAKDPHRYLVEKALSEGKPVPPEVLKDYPDLAPKPPIAGPGKEGGEGTLSYTFKRDFEEQNRQNIEGLSYIGELVSREEQPNDWVKLIYRKKAVEIQKPIAPAKESAYTESKEAENAPGGGQAVREGQLVAGSSPVAGGEQAGDREEAVSPEQARPENVPEPQGEAGSESGLQPHPQEKPASRRGRRTGNVPDNQPAPEREPAGAPAGEPETENPPVGREPRRPEDRNHVIAPEDIIFPAGKVSRINANVNAIELLRTLEKEDRNPTPEEKKILAQFTGWGALAQDVFEMDRYVSRDQEGTGELSGWMYSNEEKKKYKAWFNRIGKRLHPDLGGILTQEEWDAAKKSTLNAHYTSREVIDNALWPIVERLGVKGGTIVEPSAGVGHILSLMPPVLSGKSRIVAVELDKISGGILNKLYPEANVQITGFQSARGMKDNYADLVISNFPFGDYPVTDPKHKDYSGWSIHNYFFARSIDAVKPGGIVVGITSHYSLDAPSSAKVREYLAKKADLVGAIRLPGTAFEKSAGTSVTTDILIFRKKDSAAFEGAQSFHDVMSVKTKAGDDAPVNEYFVNHPEMVLGEHSMEGTMYGGKKEYTLEPRKDKDLTELLREAVQKLPADIAGQGAVSQEPPTTLYAEQGVKEGQIVIGEGGRVYRNEEGVLVRPSWAANPKKAAAAKTYIGIRDAARALIGLQLQEGATDDAIVAQRKKLNEAYDAFVRKQGFVSDKKNGWLSDDSDYPLALSLEVPGYIIKESTYASGERKGQKYTFKETIYKKAKIFTERTIFPFVEPRSADSLEDALKISMTYRNALDPAYIAKLVNSDVEKVQTEMAARGIAFLDPNTGLLQTPEDYLSGNVKEKLVKAEEAAKDDPRYEKNVEALKKVQPEDLKIDQIHVRLGTPWLPTEAYQDFIAETMDVRASVKYQRTSETSGFRVDAHAYGSAKATNVWGVEGATGIALVEDSLNLRFPTIYDHWMEDGKEMRQKNEQKTLAAREMQKRIQAEFEKWIRNHEKWSKEAETIFNRDFNNSVLKTFFVPDLDYYPGASHTITLRPHQKRAVSRALQESCLLAHAVGTGKTYIFTTIAAEMRRLKTARKPMIVVQGSTINQYARAYRELYPLAKVLIPNERQMEAKNRKKLLSQIATGDWDAIIVPHSAFNLLSVSPEKEAAYVRESIAELEALIRESEDTEGKKNRTVKQLEKMKERKEERIKNLLSVGREKILSFDELGIDALLIDEAHQYKRGEFYSKMSNVKGIDQGSAARSTLLLLKAREVHLKTAGKNVVTATGTPISNTMAELWTMLRYVRPDLLRAYSSEGFDEFAATFGTVVSQIEETETGSFKDIARFAKYVNGPELLTMWRTAADVILAEDVKVPRPTIRTGKPIDLQIERPPRVAEFIRGIKAARDAWDRLTGKEKMENRHVPLVLFGQAKKGAIDLRLVDSTAPDLPGSKVNRAVENIVQRWKDTKANRGTQVVFCDMYRSPDGDFNLFEDMKKKLVAKGIPAEEIAIIHDFKADEKREALFERLNDGEVRVVMGSTEKLGVGVNIQERLASAHHIDTPLRPMDFEQRNGRIWRPGNTNEEIEILVYGMKSTLDSTSFQRLLTKQKFINQVLRGDIKDRSFDDPFDPTQETFQNMIAAFGNPLVREKFALENSVRELENLRDSHQKEIGRARREIQGAKSSIENLEKLKGLWDRRAAEVKKAAPDAKATDFKIEGKALTHDEFVDLLEKDAKALEPAARRLESIVSSVEYAEFKKEDAHGPLRKGQINGIPFNAQAGLDYFYERAGGGFKALKVTVNGAKFGYQLYPGEENNRELQRTVNTADGVITSIGHMFKKILGKPAEIESSIDHNKKQIQDLTPLLDQPFSRNAEIEEKKAKLAEVDAQLKAAENEDLKAKEERAQPPEEEQRHEAIEARKEALRPELELQRFRGLFDEGNSQHKARLNSIVDATIDEALKKGEELDERPVAEIAEELRNLHNWTEEQIQGDDASARLGREVVDSYLRRPEERANLPLPKILMDEAGFIDLTLLTGGLATVIERARDRLQRARLADYFNWMRGHNEPGIRVLMGPEKHGPQTGESLRNMESVLSQTKASRSIYEGGRQFKEDTVRDFNRWKRKAQEILNPLSKEEKAAVVEILDTTEEIEGGHPVEIAAAQMRETLSRFREWMIEKGQKVGYIEGYFPHVFQGKFWIRQEGEFARKVDSLDEALKLAREAHERTGDDITIMQDTFIPPDDATMLSNRGYWRLVNTLQEEIGQAIPVMEELSREDIDHLLRGEGIARPKPRKRFFGNLMPRLVNNPNFMRDIDKVMDLFFYGGSRKVHQDIFMRGVQRNLEAMPVQDDRLKKFIEQTYLPGVLAHPTNFEEAIAKAISMGIAPWKGAVGGAAGGFLLGGPVGAGIGAVAGIIATRTPLLHRPGVSGQDVRKWMHNINLVQYVYDLGLSASSAVANASQFFINAYPIVGEKSAGLGYYRAARTFRDPALMTEVENMGITSGVSAMTGQPLLKKESLQGFARKITLQEGVGEFAEAALVMFQGVELQNRFAAYWAGKDRAIRGLNRGETAMPLAKKVAPKTSSLMALAAEIDLRMQDTTTRRTGSWWRKTRAMRERFAREFGYELNEKTNFRVGRENLPSLLRNVPVRILSPYKSFLMNQLKFTLETLSPKGLATDPKKALRFTAMTIALAGVAGNPILYGVFLLIAKLYKWLFDRDLEKEVRRLGIYRGITGRAGLDISGSVAIQLPSKPEDLLGRFGKLALELGELRYAKTKGEGTIFTERQAKRLTMPAQLQRAVDALTILKEGQYVTPIKQTPVALTEAPWTAAVKRFLGMMPVDVSSTFDREKMIQEKKAKFKSLSADMTERLTAAIREGDETEINLLALKFARQVNDAAERLTRASAGKNQDALIEALTDLTFWQSWIENKPKFKEALLRKLIPRQAGGMRRLPKYLRPEAATTP